MKNLFISLLLASLVGCTTLGDVATSKEVFVGCRAADLITTRIAILHGAYEVSSFPIPILLGLNILVSIYAWNHWEDTDTAGKSIANIISCAPVVNNINVINAQ